MNPRQLKITYRESGKEHSEHRAPFTGTLDEAIELATIELHNFNKSIRREGLPKRELVRVEFEEENP